MTGIAGMGLWLVAMVGEGSVAQAMEVNMPATFRMQVREQLILDIRRRCLIDNVFLMTPTKNSMSRLLAVKTSIG